MVYALITLALLAASPTDREDVVAAELHLPAWLARGLLAIASSRRHSPMIESVVIAFTKAVDVILIL